MWIGVSTILNAGLGQQAVRLLSSLPICGTIKDGNVGKTGKIALNSLKNAGAWVILCIVLYDEMMGASPRRCCGDFIVFH